MPVATSYLTGRGLKFLIRKRLEIPHGERELSLTSRASCSWPSALKLSKPSHDVIKMSS